MSTGRILVTGAAGFIGFHLSLSLLAKGFEVYGLDNLNDYYDQRLKHSRLDILKKSNQFQFIELDLTNKPKLTSLFEEKKFEYVANLAAQAGVRYSLTNPDVYVESNIQGFLNILECCRLHGVSHLLYASSGSVYGANKTMPFSVHDNVDHPLSLYAASKKANELMAHAYSSLFNLPTTGLRFFSAYGPFGRPDMAMFIFTRAILDGKPIDIYNHGSMKRDFTYVDDIAEGVSRLVKHIPAPNADWDGSAPDAATSFAPYRVYNIGNGNPVDLMYAVGVLEEKLGKKAVKNYMPLQAGDIPGTFADVEDLWRDVGFRPEVKIETGISRFVDWYLDYYKI